jgi:diketogulonate reductase-like aldo/keto reductase
MWGDVDASKCDMDAVAKRHGHTIGEANARATVNDPLTFGFWRLDNPEETVFQAIKAGYRRLDSACDYGNEVETGKGIQRAIDAGICKREDLHITSKLWNTYHKPEHVELAFKRTLSDLGLTYLDEYLIHFPISMEFVPFEKKYPPEWANLNGDMVVVPNDINKTWAAMESLVDKGLTKAIGISNFNCQHLRQLLSVARIRPTTLQVELHPHNPQQKLLNFARNSGMRVAAFSPLGGTSYISLGMATNDDVLMNSKTVQSVAAKYNKTAVQIMLRWAVQRGTLPISKTSTISRMSENRAVMDFYLHKDDMATMNALCINSRYNDPGMFCNPPCPIYE